MSIIKFENIPEQLMEYKEVIFIVNILSHKWSLGILLSLAEKEVMRFNQLRRHLDVSHSVLSKELKNLEDQCLINRQIISEMNPPSVEYSLTCYGRHLAQICQEMKDFGCELEQKVFSVHGSRPTG